MCNVEQGGVRVLLKRTIIKYYLGVDNEPDYLRNYTAKADDCLAESKIGGIIPE